MLQLRQGSRLDPAYVGHFKTQAYSPKPQEIFSAEIDGSLYIKRAVGSFTSPELNYSLNRYDDLITGPIFAAAIRCLATSI
jgi:hypothetical protein